MLAIRYIAMTSLYAYFMQSSSKEQAGTDFTILVCFELLVYFIGGASSGFLAKSLGYGTFLFGIGNGICNQCTYLANALFHNIKN